MKDYEAKNRLESLIALPKSKQVLAFKEVLLEDLSEYVEWAMKALDASLGQEIDDALLLVACLYDQDPINYFEMKQQLNAFSRMLHLSPPQGANAVKLFCIGLVEGPLPNDCFEEYDIKEELEIVLEPYPEIRDFDCLKNWKGNLFAPQEGAGKLRPFRREVEKLAKKWYVSVHQEEGNWHFDVKER